MKKSLLVVATVLLVVVFATVAQASVLFVDGFNRNEDTFPNWAVARSDPEDIKTVTSPVRSGSHAAKFTVEESDLPFAGNVNPRAQLNKDHLFCEGDERYVGSSVYVPSSFPDTLPSDGWFILGSHGYAENAAGEYKGSSPGSLHMVPGSSGVTRFGYRQDESYNFAELWRGPSVQENKWYDFVFHIKFSRDASVGFVELWVDGELQTLTDGSTRAYYRTLKDGTVGCGSLIRTQYRKEMMGLPDPTTIYHDQVKVGTSYTEVAP